MDERSLQGLFSNLIPDEIEGLLTQGGLQEGEQQSRAVALLKTAARRAGGEAGEEINNFLNGSGLLLETTRSAAARGGTSVSATIADFLAERLGLSPALARILAPLLVSLLPGILKQTGSDTVAKPRPKPKKPKTSASSKPKKPKSSSSAKPAGQAKPKKPASSASNKPKAPTSSTGSKPKKPASSTSSKPKAPKTSTSSKPKTTGSKKPAAKPKRPSRAGEIPEP